MIQINQPIVGYSVVDVGSDSIPALASPALIPRPAVLSGTTYKVKTPMSDHALYLTINDYEGKPFEIFINSKAMDHFQWIVALTRVLSAVFRHGGDVAFLVDELRSICDPKGGYFQKGGRFVPSLVAEIGDVLATHLTRLGLLTPDTSLAQAAQAMVAEKKGGKPEGLLCEKCHELSVVVMDGCRTCLQCGSSACG
jgi:hypothetical protein